MVFFIVSICTQEQVVHALSLNYVLYYSLTSCHIINTLYYTVLH